MTDLTVGLFRSKWTDPSGKGFDLNTFLKCQPTFDLSAWLKDSSKRELKTPAGCEA